ncbi:MAG: DUF4352 domain-containing protein [Thermoplasmatota archaeon]
MRLVLGLTVIATLLAGCASSALAAPTITITDASGAPADLTVSLKNNAASSEAVSATGFSLVDANGTTYQIDSTTMASEGPGAFPTVATIGQGQSAQGGLIFSYVNTPVGPWKLQYNYGGLSATVPISK